jgi:O-antigen/teichoic acid export membrane protein
MARLSLFSGLSLFLLRAEVLSLFGREYQAGANLLAILLVGQVGAGLLGLNTPLLLASGYAWAELLVTSLCAIAMTLSGIVLGQIYGTLGVAIATATVTIILALARHTACIIFCGISKKWGLRITFAGFASLMAALLVQKIVPGSNIVNTLLTLSVFSCVYWGFNIASVSTLISHILQNQRMNSN